MLETVRQATYEQTLARVRATSGVNYTPDYAYLADVVGDKTLVILDGPTFAGKTTLAAAMAKADESFRPVQSFTTRPRLPHEAPDAYEWLDPTIGTLTDIQQGLREQRYVQCTVHPTTNTVYGSKPAAYEGQFPILTPVKDELPALHRLPFHAQISLAVVRPALAYANTLRHNLGQRDQLMQRVAQSIVSLKASLDTDKPTIWLPNTNLTTSARYAIELSHLASRQIDVADYVQRNYPQHQETGRLMAQGMRDVLRTLLATAATRS